MANTRLADLKAKLAEFEKSLDGVPEQTPIQDKLLSQAHQLICSAGSTIQDGAEHVYSDDVFECIQELEHAVRILKLML